MHLKKTMANATFPDVIKICYSNGNSYSFGFKFPSSLVFAIHLFACILSGIILLTTICLNLLTVLTFWRTPRLRKNASLYLVMILSFVDAGIGVSCNPFLTIGIIYDLKHSSACWVYDIQLKLLRPSLSCPFRSLPLSALNDILELYIHSFIVQK